ncbi:MAG: hypothetical protein GC162_19080 [Planctomycetes bacterium]|nr:hypothetical protein [Planctomycetota bacterium]
MAKKDKSSPIILQWTKHVPTADVQDPLGTSLRGSTRIANRLLFCITSITPRARYFTFVPWCVYDYNKRERGTPHALGLRDAIVLREHALTLGCIAHHDGAACAGGALVGTREAIRWYGSHNGSEANLRRLRFAKNPAMNAYFNSLVNLGVFITEEDIPELEDDEEPIELTFDDIELSAMGLEIAAAYDAAVGRLQAVSEVASRSRRCAVTTLKAWGRKGGLCELALPTSPDRDLLRDIFFTRRELPGKAHADRRRTLLLMLDLARRLTTNGWSFDAVTFADSVYFGEVSDEDENHAVAISSPLTDISLRWRMFYFHYYMAVALEGIFSWLVTRLRGAGLAGESLDGLVSDLNGLGVRRDISLFAGVHLEEPFGLISPRRLFALLGTPLELIDYDTSATIDGSRRVSGPISEPILEGVIRNDDYQDPTSAFAASLLLLAITLARYKRWDATQYGQWLASAAADPYLDLVPPVVLHGMERRFQNWWDTPFVELGMFVLHRFVIQQHQAMSYEKVASGARCLLQIDGDRVLSTGTYDKIGTGNARFPSALQVLIDLGLLSRDDSNDIVVTEDGDLFLSQEMATEATE